ncbi:MAG: DUF6171 family protein [Eubacteriales bacterium]
MNRPPCPRCPHTEEDVSLDEAITRYVKALDEDIRCPAPEYSRRLGICGECEGRSGATCVHCGCFVGMRAAIAVRGCPHPSGDRWA